MKELEVQVKAAQEEFTQLLRQMTETTGLSKDVYHRFLTYQYHLTKGVQKHFLFIAGHPATARMRSLRNWLVKFAFEEEFHFEIARNDLKSLGLEPLECPLDIKLWWAFFNEAIKDRPFLRLGATAILENIADGSAPILDGLIKNADYLNPSCLRFLTIHRHGPNLAHGDQVLDNLAEADLSATEMADALEGARMATVMYMRLIKWAATGKEAF